MAMTTIRKVSVIIRLYVDGLENDDAIGVRGLATILRLDTKRGSVGAGFDGL
jgi:hypothetical protein